MTQKQSYFELNVALVQEELIKAEAKLQELLEEK